MIFLEKLSFHPYNLLWIMRIYSSASVEGSAILRR